MLYRIEVKIPRADEVNLFPDPDDIEFVAETFVGPTTIEEAADLMERSGLPGPRKHQHNRTSFYYTQLGWNTFGRKLVTALRQLGYEVRIEQQKNQNKGNIAYSDPYQVALLPLTRGKGKRYKRNKRLDRHEH